MSEIGIDPSNTSKRLGHASSQVTLDVYTHTTKTGEKNSIDKFADYLNKSKINHDFKNLEEVIRRLSQSYLSSKNRQKKHFAKFLQSALKR